MDFVAGKSLADRLGEGISIAEAARLMKSIAEAVHFAHQRGIVHRDLKPANVLLDEFGQPRITDFGLAKRLDRGEQLTVSGAVLGTPDYMSPEQAAGRQDMSGPASDVFSLGAMLYAMITGRVPFRGANLAELLSHILQDEPERPSRLNPRVPPDLETICLKCLEKRPDRRYASADALAKDLGRFLDHEAISARPVGRSRQVSRWFVGHPQLLAALASGVLLGLVWLVYGLWTENRILAWEKDHSPTVKPASYLLGSEGQALLWTVSLLSIMSALQRLLNRKIRQRVLTGRFIAPWMLNAVGLAGVVGIAWSVYLGAAGIESWRWAVHALPLAHGKIGGMSFKELQKRASLLEVLANIIIAIGASGFGAGLALKAFREQRFAFYHSAEEEQTALSQASREQQKIAEKERRGRKFRGFLILLSSLSVFIDSNKGAWPLEQKFLIILGVGSIYALAVLLVLQDWRTSSHRQMLHRKLLGIATLVAVLALARMPASLWWREALFESVTGGAFGLFLRMSRKKEDEYKAMTKRDLLVKR